MFSINLENILHSFILYTIFGSILSFILVVSATKILKIYEPRMKMQMLALPMLTPILSFLIYHTVLNKRCSLGLLYQHGSYMAIIEQGLHYLSNWFILILTPLYVIAFIMAATKGIVSIIACRRIVDKYGYVSKKEYPELFEIYNNLIEKASINPPRLIITSQKYARSFTFGFRKPVIVISKGILDFLDNEEIEALLAHEIGHIIRKDSINNWFTVLIRDLIFFTPVTFWTFNLLSNEKEKATDDITIKLTEKPLAFAHALIKVWKLSPKSLLSNLALDNFMPNPGFLKNKFSIEERVERVIEGKIDYNFNGKKVFITGTLITLLVIFLLSFIC